MSAEQGREFAESQGAGFCEISSKTRENIKKPFVEVVDQIVQRPQLIAGATSPKTIDFDIGGFPSNPCSC